MSFYPYFTPDACSLLPMVAICHDYEGWCIEFGWLNWGFGINFGTND